MDPMKNFEIPSDMRKFAEQSVEQARQAFGGFINAAQQAVNDMEGRASTARTGAKDVGEKAMTFAQQQHHGVVRIRPETGAGEGRAGSDEVADRIYPDADAGR